MSCYKFMKHRMGCYKVLYTCDVGRLLGLSFRGFGHPNLTWCDNTLYETIAMPSASQLEKLGVGAQCDRRLPLEMLCTILSLVK